MISPLLIVFILINSVAFFVLLIKFVVEETSQKYQNIVKAETAILGIAFTQYAITFVIENSNILDKDVSAFAQELRYVDWLITTPLLLYTYWKLAKIEGYEGDFFLIFIMDIIMIVCGILGEVIYKNKFKISLIFFSIGSIAFIVIVFEIIRIMKFFNRKNLLEERNLGWYFLLGWLIYPVGYFFNDNTKFILYSIGDFINKFLYSISLSKIISKKF